MKLIRRFFSYYRPHRRLFIVDLICSFTISVCNLFYPMIARNIMNDYVPNQNLRLLIVWAIVLAAIYAVKSVLTFIVGYWGHVLGVRIQGDMRRDLFRHIETQPFSFFDENKTGGIMSRIINDLFEVSELAHHGPEDVFNSFISIVGALIMLCTINGWLALIVLCYIPFMLFFAIKARGRMNKAFEESRKKVAEINAEIESSVSGASRRLTTPKTRKRKSLTSSTADLKRRARNPIARWECFRGVCLRSTTFCICWLSFRADCCSISTSSRARTLRRIFSISPCF